MIVNNYFSQTFTFSYKQFSVIVSNLFFNVNIALIGVTVKLKSRTHFFA